MSLVKQPSTCLRSVEPNELVRTASVRLDRRMLLGASVAWCLFGSPRSLPFLGAPEAPFIRNGWVLSKGD